MRMIFLCLTLFLSACSIDSMANKILPDAVKSQSVEAVDAVLNGNADYFASLKTDNFTPEQFEAQLGKMLDFMPQGEEISRHIVSANSKIGTNSKTGSYKQYDVMYKIKTSEGYGTVALVYVPDPETETCCKMQSVYVNKFETSPYHENAVKMMHYSKIAGIVILILLIGLIVFFVRRRKKKRLGA